MPVIVVCLLLSVTVLFLFFSMSNTRAEGRLKMPKTEENQWMRLLGWWRVMWSKGEWERWSLTIFKDWKQWKDEGAEWFVEGSGEKRQQHGGTFRSQTMKMGSNPASSTCCCYCCCCCCCYVASVVSDSVRPHRRQPTRLPRPWDFPGKNTGVGCHFFLQRVKVKSER